MILIGKNPLLFIVNPKVPAKTLGEFVALAKANPGEFNYGTPGAASQAHLLVALWSKLAGIEMQHIPYRGGAPAVLGTVAGEVQFTVMSPLASLAQINAGALRALAVGECARATRISPTCRRSPRAASPASRRWPGSGCSPPPARRRRSSTVSMRR